MARRRNKPAADEPEENPTPDAVDNDSSSELDEDSLLVGDDEELDIEDSFVADDSGEEPGDADRDGDDPDEDEAEDEASEDESSEDEPAADDGPVDGVPFELREDLPDPEHEPKTGLVSELRDLTFGQAAWLVSNREANGAARGPLYLIPTLLIVLGVVAGLFIGSAREQAGADPSDSTLAVVGVSDEAQIQQFEQAYGFAVLGVETAEEADAAVRSGEADAALLPDTTGMGAPQIIALRDEPTAILEAINPPQEVTYLEPATIAAPLSTALAWGLAIALLLSAIGLGTALFNNLLVERRNRIGEILSSAIPPKASAWGRVYGITGLSVSHLAIGYVLLLLGLSIAGKTDVVVASLPVLGWFAALAVLTVFGYASLLLASGSAVGQRARKIGYGISTGILIVAGLGPIVAAQFSEIVYWASFVPFTSPTAMALRLMEGSALWWEPLVSVGAALVLGIVLYLIGQRAYIANMLRGAGRSGRVAVAKRDKKAAKKAKAEKRAAASSEKKEEDSEDSGEDDAEDDAAGSEEDSSASAEEGSEDEIADDGDETAAGEASEDEIADRDEALGGSDADAAGSGDDPDADEKAVKKRR